MAFLVAITGPERLNVPYFALAVPQTRAYWASPVGRGAEACRDFGGRVRAWLEANIPPDRVEALRTRDFRPPRTAIYIGWLHFQRAADRARFLAENPGFDSEAAAARLRARQAELALAIEERTRRGDFDLSRFGGGHRLALARNYVAMAETLKTIAAEIADIELVRLLAERWERHGEIARHLIGEE